MLQKVVLGRTGLEVSVAALGAGGKSRLGQARGASVADSVALVRAAMDLGVTLIDTAASYKTEEIVGEAVKGRRDKVVISTKVLTTVDASRQPISGADLERRTDRALQKLGTDYVDIMYLHGLAAAHYDHAREELIPAFDKLRRAGKIRFSAVSENFRDDMGGHAMLARAAADGLFDVMMIGLNFVNQTALKAVLPAAKKNGVGTLCMFAVRGPLARLESANALVEKLIGTGEVDPATVDAANPLGFLVEPGVASSISEAAYRWCRHAPGMDVVLTGTGSQAHLKENLASISGPPLPAAVQDRLARIFGKVTRETCEP